MPHLIEDIERYTAWNKYKELAEKQGRFSHSDQYPFDFGYLECRRVEAEKIEKDDSFSTMSEARRIYFWQKDKIDELKKDIELLKRGVLALADKHHAESPLKHNQELINDITKFFGQGGVL